MTDGLHVDGDRPAVARVAALPASWTNEADRLVLYALACDSFDGETCAPGYDNLARWTGLHRGTVYEIIGRLSRPVPGRRPALVEKVETHRGGPRTRFRLLPLASASSEPSDDTGRSKPSDDTGRSTVGQPSANRPTTPDGQPSVNRPVNQNPPPLPSRTPSPQPPRGVADEVRAALRELEIGEGEIEDLIQHATADPTTQSLRRLMTDAYRAQARKAVADANAARDQDDRRATATQQLQRLSATDARAQRVIDDLTSSYADSPTLLLHHVTAQLAEMSDEAPPIRATSGTRDRQQRSAL